MNDYNKHIIHLFGYLASKSRVDNLFGNLIEDELFSGGCFRVKTAVACCSSKCGRSFA
jgi:hypothetical protein